MDCKNDHRDIEDHDVNNAQYDYFNELYANNKSANTYDKVNKTTLFSDCASNNKNGNGK